MIVEDGTGVENANSYVGLDFADSYFEERGKTAWLGIEDTDKESALVRATDFIDASFKWRGRRSSKTQVLCFPRTGIVDDDGYKVEGIPLALKQAVCEAADMARGGNALFSERNENGAVTSEKIGSLSFTYDSSRGEKDKTLYEAVNLKLCGLFIDTNKSKVISGRIEK